MYERSLARDFVERRKRRDGHGLLALDDPKGAAPGARDYDSEPSGCRLEAGATRSENLGLPDELLLHTVGC